MRNFEQLRKAAAAGPTRRAAVVFPHDTDTVVAACEAAEQGLIEPVFVGNAQQIRQLLEQAGRTVGAWKLLQANDAAEAAAAAVALVRAGEADLLMKGLLDTKLILQAVLDPEKGLRTGRVLSHVAAFSLPLYTKLLFLSDAAITILPTLAQKREIIMNAAEVARAVGVLRPKVAMICAKEKPDPKMPATLDAATLQQESVAAALGDCMVSGPLALDNAVSHEAATQKGIQDPVAGDADILLMPNIEAGNAVYKALVFLAGAGNAGIVVGAAAPVVLTSRADSQESKLNSIALAALHAARHADA